MLKKIEGIDIPLMTGEPENLKLKSQDTRWIKT